MDKIDKLMVMEAALMVCGDVLGKKVRKKLEAHIEKELYLVSDAVGLRLGGVMLPLTGKEKRCLSEFKDYLQQQKAAVIKLSEAKEVFGYGI